MGRDRWLELEGVHARGRQLFLVANLDGQRFSTSIWYGDVHLERLAASVGQEAFERLAFHVAAFEINKLASLRPTHLSFGRWARFVTPSFVELWSTVLQKVWAQWRYEHVVPDWRGPELADPIVQRADLALDFLTEDRGEALLFFGGGKDSLVAAHLLERAELPYAAQSYAHSVYGRPDTQHALIDALLDRLAPLRRHKQWVSDDTFAAPLPELLPDSDTRYVLAAETPSSIFAALPTVLTHGYRAMVLAHEFSANRGNLVWPLTGEEVNHQWGKSWHAESLIAHYIERELIPDFHWFSILQPLSDVLIFELLRDTGPRVLQTHSCNVQKPWCGRCAKCAYVALGYAAHLPEGVYESIFPMDVLDLPENELFFRQMIGLAEHTPFECIGEIDEARLALALAAARGRRARAVELFQREGGALDLDSVIERYATVHRSAPHGIPEVVARRVLPLMDQAEVAARARIRALLTL